MTDTDPPTPRPIPVERTYVVPPGEPDIRDTAGHLVQVSRFGSEIHVRREAVGGDDWIELRLPAASGTGLAYRLLALAAGIQGAFPSDGDTNADE